MVIVLPVNFATADGAGRVRETVVWAPSTVTECFSASEARQTFSRNSWSVSIAATWEGSAAKSCCAVSCMPPIVADRMRLSWQPGQQWRCPHGGLLMSQSMTTDQGMISEVVARLDPETLSRASAPADLVARYLEHQHSDDLDDIGADNVAAIIDAHVTVSTHRAAEADSVVADAPDASDTWRLSGSTLLQIVTDDRPFLVDSLTMEITRQNWTIRHVFHPQLRVARDTDRELVQEGAGEMIAESWMTFVVYPPLGVAADELADQLVGGVREVLAEIRLVTDDWTAMRTQLSDAVDLLGTSTYDSCPDDRDSARDLLRWLRDDNFTLLGYRTYSYDGIRYEPVPGNGLGVLRTVDDPFDALPTPGENGVLVFTKDSVRCLLYT